MRGEFGFDGGDGIPLGGEVAGDEKRAPGSRSDLKRRLPFLKSCFSGQTSLPSLFFT